MYTKEFDIRKVMTNLSKLRQGFTLEGDFQFMLGYVIKKMYRHAQVIMEYNYPSGTLLKEEKDTRQSIDVLVIFNKNCYPIELKYNYDYKRGIIKLDKDIDYKINNVSEQGTTDFRRKYCKDIERLLNLNNITKEIDSFKIKESYAILLTNFTEFRDKTANLTKYILSNDSIEEVDNDFKDINVKYDLEWNEYGNENVNNLNYLLATIKLNDK